MTPESVSPSLIDEEARRHFERAWRAGTPLPIEELLPAEEDPRYLPTLEELILIELELSWKGRPAGGEAPSPCPPPRPVEEYLRRFPCLNQPAIVQRLMAEEQEIRQRHGMAPTPTEKFPSPATPVLGRQAPPAAGQAQVPGYTILGVLGRGGMGVVYRAVQHGLDRVVALKMIQGRGLADDEVLGRFQREAEAIARLRHPNIVQIYEVGEHEGAPFFSLELMEGGTLAERVAGAPLAAREAARLVGTVAQAIQAAHQQGIIHRDLKPANVLLTAEGGIKVSDFGLAKRLEQDAGQTQTGQVLGTPSYMAPEQAAGQAKQVGPATDVYALGAVLYELLTGRPPFRAATVLDTLEQVRGQEPVPPSRLQPRVPRDLETICLKCLQKAPAGRYPSAQALADDLARFLAGQPIQARPAGTWERTLKWVRRQPVLAALLAVSAVALVALAGVAVSLFYSSRLEGALHLAETERAEAQTQRARAGEEAAEAQRQRVRAREQEALAQRYLYLARMGLAQRAWEAGEAAQVLDLLEEYEQPGPDREDYRGFEWHYLRSISRHLRTLRGHQAEVEDAAFSPDGKGLASCGADGTVRLWDAERGRLIRTLKGPGKWVSQVAFLPDGRRVAAAGEKGVLVWEVPEGRKILSFTRHAKGVLALALSPDGSRLASYGADRTVKVWDSATGKVHLTFTLKDESVSGLAYSPDGQRLAWAGRVGPLGNSGKIRVREAASGKEIVSVATARAEELAWSPDGKLLATGGPRGEVTLWDAEQGKQVAALEGKGENIRCVTFSPDGSRLAAAGQDRVVRVWDVAARKELYALRGHQARVRGFLSPDMGVNVVAFSPDGSRLVSGAEDGTLKVWSLEERRPLPLPQGIPEKAKYRLYSQDRKWLASSEGQDTVTVWDLTAGQALRELKSPEERTRPLVFSRDGRLLAVGCTDLPILTRIRKVKVWDIHTGREALTLEARDQVLQTAFSPDGRWLALGGHGVVLGDTSTGKKVHTLEGHDFTVYGVAFSPDGRQLASASEDATVKLWDVQTGQEHFTLHGHQWGVNTAAFSPDGETLASGGGDNTVRLWDTRSGKLVATLLGLSGHREGVDTVSFSPDGQRILSVGREGMVKVWDRETGLEVLTVTGNTREVLAAWWQTQRQALGR